MSQRDLIGAVLGPLEGLISDPQTPKKKEKLATHSTHTLPDGAIYAQARLLLESRSLGGSN